MTAFAVSISAKRRHLPKILSHFKLLEFPSWGESHIRKGNSDHSGGDIIEMLKNIKHLCRMRIQYSYSKIIILKVGETIISGNPIRRLQTLKKLGDI